MSCFIYSSFFAPGNLKVENSVRIKLCLKFGDRAECQHPALESVTTVKNFMIIRTTNAWIIYAVQSCLPKREALQDLQMARFGSLIYSLCVIWGFPPPEKPKKKKGATAEKKNPFRFYQRDAQKLVLRPRKVPRQSSMGVVAPAIPLPGSLPGSWSSEMD